MINKTMSRCMLFGYTSSRLLIFITFILKNKTDKALVGIRDLNVCRMPLSSPIDSCAMCFDGLLARTNIKRMKKGGS